MYRLTPVRVIVLPPLIVTVPGVTFPGSMSQTLNVPLATLSPAGSVSVKVIPVRSVRLVSGLFRPKLSVVVPFNGMLAAPNDIEMVGGVRTVMLAVAVPPEPPSFEVTLPVVVLHMPSAAPMMSIEKVQLVLAASDAPLRLT
jgi:hypothetical protein